MSPRLPFIAVVGLVVAGALLASEGSGRADSAAPALPAAPVSDQTGSGTWFCAGGTAAAGGFADHTVVIANAGAGDAVGQLAIVPGGFAGQGGAEAAGVTSPVRLRVGEQVRVRLGDLVVAPLAGAVVEMDEGEVTVDHEVRGPLGQDAAPCLRQSSASWHFAWGATTRDARQTLVLFNPYANDVAVDAVFSTDRGVREPVRWQGLSVPAHSVVGIDVGDDVTRREQISATLQVRGGRLIVDRIQSFDGQLGPSGLSVAAGSPEAAERWTFADGRVADDIGERVVLYNPGTVPAEVEVTVHGTSSGSDDEPAPEPFGVVVRPGGFELLTLDEQSRVSRSTPHAITVEVRNGVPVVAERVSAGPGRIDAEPGQPTVADAWTFSGPAGQHYAVFNPDGTRSVRVTLGVRDAGTGELSRLRGVEVAPLGRVELTVPASGPIPLPLTVLLESNHPVVAEPIP